MKIFSRQFHLTNALNELDGEARRQRGSRSAGELLSLTTNGIRRARNWQPQTAAKVEVKWFRVKSVQRDYLICNEWTWSADNTGSASATDTNVALPYRLRRSPFDAKVYGAIRYTYISNIERQAVPESSPTGLPESQIIIPEFVLNADLIAAAKMTATGVWVDSVELQWSDLNIDGRYWAAY